jgi:hypothetical protein
MKEIPFAKPSSPTVCLHHNNIYPIHCSYGQSVSTENQNTKSIRMFRMLLQFSMMRSQLNSDSEPFGAAQSTA